MATLVLTADRNWQRNLMRARPRWRGGWVLGLSLGLCAIAGCSKGGAPDSGSTCRKLSDPEPGSEEKPMTPKALYVELRSAGGTIVPITLDGTGGTYSGSRPVSKCDEMSGYTVEKVVLIDVKGEPVAEANRVNTSYLVKYAGGQTATVTGAGFTNISAMFAVPVPSGATTVKAVTAVPTMVRQGDSVSVQVDLVGDDCGIKSSTWWLSSASVGSVTTAKSSIMGGSGSVSFRIPPTLEPTKYYVEGEVLLKSGNRTLQIRRQMAADSTYKVYDMRTGVFMPTTIPVATVDVGLNVDADKTAPQAVSMEATPAVAGRCTQVNLALKLSDDKALPTMQKVKVNLGTLEMPNLLSTTVSGDEFLYGSVTLPSDAPSGVWFAYPDLVRDNAGNEARGSIAAGKFSLAGPGIAAPTPVNAATFNVPGSASPDGGMPPLPDMAVASDMAAVLPVILTGVAISPTTVSKEGDPITVTISWNDVAKILR